MRLVLLSLFLFAPVLLVGALEVREAQKLGIPHVLLVPALILTFLFGPIGLLLFAVIKALRTRSLTEVISC